MQFAVSFPWWVLLLMAGAVVLVAWASYPGGAVPLPRRQRTALITLRALALLLLLACLLRPVRVIPPDTSSDAVVPVLVDVSRSMGVADVQGRPRIDVARDLLQARVQPALDGRFRTETWTFGDVLERQAPGALIAHGRQSDLAGALRALRERYRERRLAGIVVLSDGGATGAQDAAAAVGDGSVPVYAVGIGAPTIARDYEVLGVAAGEAVLAESSVDLGASVVSRGDAAPFDVRVLENGRPIDLRRVAPAADGSPVHVVFTVSPARETATVYTVEIPTAPGELVLENNRRSVLVEPPGRARRILMLEGAPGFEHSFIKRALATDSGIELDSVVRKGRDARGDATYFVQAAAARAPRLATGFPQDRAALFTYDGVMLANLEGDALSRGQLQMLAEFVDVRGGGLLVLGAKSFAQQGYAATPLDEVLPLQSTDRGGGVVPTSAARDTRLSVRLTSEGRAHPVMRIEGDAAGLEKRWRALPPLAGVAALGALRPGAEALALVHAADGPRPLVAIQRYGQGRSMIFSGEASWRWRMQMPSSDRTYELFWRQAARWISAPAPDRVSIAALPSAIPLRSAAAASVDVRTEDFAPLAGAEVQMRATVPGGRTIDLPASLDDPQTGRYTGELRFETPGVYRISVTARHDGEVIGATERWALAGGVDVEMADPRLNEDVLRRVAVASGGGYLAAEDAARLPALLAAAAAEPAPPRLEELWHSIWIFAGVVLLLGTEWMLRRRWGLR